MIPWQLLDTARIPKPNQRPGQGRELAADAELRLYQRGDEFSLRVGNWELMNSRSHTSEQEISSLACKKLAERTTGDDAPSRCVLIGGLGMGFSLRTALDELPDSATVVISELVPEVVRWNREYLGHLADSPLDDPRVQVHVGDVAERIRSHRDTHDAIILDVDNGPHTRSSRSEGWLYSASGLDAIRKSLRSRGVLSVWSSGPAPGFTERVAEKGFEVEEVRCRSHGDRGNRYVIWIAQRKR